jgi:hypothetical protein
MRVHIRAGFGSIIPDFNRFLKIVGRKQGIRKSKYMTLEKKSGTLPAIRRTCERGWHYYYYGLGGSKMRYPMIRSTKKPPNLKLFLAS